ncbi:heavy metal-binding domain-containing protein [Variovorax paradoxus]|uniref:heavy metal-binding domain-containing protein n=1 Tax=Variovorax paradoxus TaxID=34073 RepID=UPI0035209D53
MHPEIRQNQPGNCPKCGMTLEPVMPTLEEGEDPELRDFKRRFIWTLPLTIAVTVLAMEGTACNGSRWRRRVGSNWFFPLPWCCGPDGLSSSARCNRW